MNVRFTYPYCSDNAISIKAGERLELITLTNAQAEFKQFEMPLNLFFKITEPVKESSKGQKTIYPKNFEQQFELLWAAKGKKGSKQKAKAKFKSMLKDADEEICEKLTDKFVTHIESNQNELGLPEMHLTTYLNQARWEK